MTPWGYIWSGIGCALVAGFLFFIAQPTDLEIAMATAQQAFGDTADQPHTNENLMLVGYLFALAAAVLMPIGLIGQGVRIGSREAQADYDRQNAAN